MKTESIFERASTPLAGIVDIGTSKQLFIDDLLVDETSRISRYQYRPTQYADNPWDKPNLGFIEFEGSSRNNYDRHALRAQLL